MGKTINSHCDKAFSYRSTFVKHTMTHTGEKAYHCSNCDITFSINNDLITHLRMHKGEKPYECSHMLKNNVQLKHPR